MPARVSYILAIALASSFAVGIGALIVTPNDAPPSLVAINAGAWVFGLPLCVLLAQQRPNVLAIGAAILAPAFLAATFLHAGQLDVHRWISIGPVTLNMAALFLPALVVALTSTIRLLSAPWIASLACLALLATQPDASQATALAAAQMAVLLRTPGAIIWRLFAALVIASLTILAWLQPDPLAPVPEVEGVVALAFNTSLILGIASLASLIAALLAPLAVGLQRTPIRELPTATLALGAYFAATVITPFLGHFPVPLLGIGASPILGYWLGTGLLLAQRFAEVGADDEGSKR